MILNQAWNNETFDDLNCIFGFLDENIVNQSLYKFTYTKTQKKYEITIVLQYKWYRARQ